MLTGYLGAAAGGSGEVAEPVGRESVEPCCWGLMDFSVCDMSAFMMVQCYVIY